MVQTSLRWYAVRVRNQHEDLVAKHFRSRQLEHFHPTFRAKHRWTDRTREIDVPVFAGYVFCQFDVAHRLAVLTVPGVMHIVGVGKKPCPIDDPEISALQTAVKSGLLLSPAPFLQVGQRVMIEHGPLSGVQGVLLELRNRQKIVMSVTLLQRSVSVEISEDWVRPVH